MFTFTIVAGQTTVANFVAGSFFYEREPCQFSEPGNRGTGGDFDRRQRRGYDFCANQCGGGGVDDTGRAAGGISAPASITVSAAGSLWLASSGNNTVTEVIGVAAPVTTPTVQQVINQNPGTKP